MINFQQRIPDHRETFPFNTRTMDSGQWTTAITSNNEWRFFLNRRQTFLIVFDVWCITINKLSFQFKIVLFEVDEVHETKKGIDSMQ